MKHKLLKARLSKGLSQEEIADLLGITQPNYSRREKGQKQISEAEWIKLSEVLCVKKDDIYEPYIMPADKKNSNENTPFNIEQFNVPSFIIEYIEMLNEQIKSLKEKLNNQD